MEGMLYCARKQERCVMEGMLYCARKQEKNISARRAEEKMKMKKEKEKTKMFKTVLTYFAAKKVITCVVLATMLIGVMAVACVAVNIPHNIDHLHRSN